MSDTDPATPAPTPPPPATPSKEQLQLAMKAFRKRMKLMKLDDESRLGYGPMTKGGRSEVVAIRPPDQFPNEVWQELARLGRLKHMGGGLYEIVGS